MSLPLAASLPNGRVMPRARGEGARERERGTFLFKGKTATTPPPLFGGRGGDSQFSAPPLPVQKKKKKNPFLIAPRRFAQQIHLTSNFLERRCLRAKYELHLPSLPPAFSAVFSSSYHEKNKSFVHIFFFCEGGGTPFIISAHSSTSRSPPLACSSSSSTTLPSIYNHRLPFLPTFPTFSPPFPYHTFFFV
jgi:hypothetical protein